MPRRVRRSAYWVCSTPEAAVAACWIGSGLAGTAAAFWQDKRPKPAARLKAAKVVRIVFLHDDPKANQLDHVRFHSAGPFLKDFDTERQHGAKPGRMRGMIGQVVAGFGMKQHSK